MRSIEWLLRAVSLLTVVGNPAVGWKMNLVDPGSFRVRLTREEARKWRIIEESEVDEKTQEGVPETSVVDTLSVVLEGVFIPHDPFIIDHRVPGWILERLGINPAASSFALSEFALLKSTKLPQRDSLGLRGALSLSVIYDKHRDRKFYIFIEMIIPRQPSWDSREECYYVDISMGVQLVHWGKWTGEVPQFKRVAKDGEKIAKLVVRKINKIADSTESRIKAKITRRVVSYFSFFLKELMRTILRRKKDEFRLCPHTMSYGNVLLYTRDPLPPYSTGKWTIGRQTRQMIFFSYYILTGDKGIRLEGSLLRVVEPPGKVLQESKLPLLHSPGHSVSAIVKRWEKVKKDIEGFGLRVEKIAVASSWTEWDADLVGATLFFQTSSPNTTTRNTLYRMLKDGILRVLGEEKGNEVLALFPRRHTLAVTDALRDVAAWYAENVVEEVMKERLVEDWKFEEFPEPWNQVV